jgi:hypothetical protein
MCAILSYNYAIFFTSCAMLSMCAIASFSLSSLTFGGVLGVIFSINFVISYLYLSIVCAIFLYILFCCDLQFMCTVFSFLRCGVYPLYFIFPVCSIFISCHPEFLSRAHCLLLFGFFFVFLVFSSFFFF